MSGGPSILARLFWICCCTDLRLWRRGREAYPGLPALVGICGKKPCGSYFSHLLIDEFVLRLEVCLDAAIFLVAVVFETTFIARGSNCASFSNSFFTGAAKPNASG